MRYQILMLNVPNRFYSALKQRFGGMDVNFIMALTARQATELCSEQTFHLIILKFSDPALCSKFLVTLRNVNYAPTIALMDQYDVACACDALQSGADLCFGAGWSVDLVVDHMMAQFRRYVSYTHLEEQPKRGKDFFQVGDIYIDPQRGVVRVKERSVRLRRREFLLLLYLMKHPKIILSAEQICKNAWDNEVSYEHGISGPIAILRKAIEPDPAHPIYIKTVKMFGYCFTAHKSETCDICSDSVGLL